MVNSPPPDLLAWPPHSWIPWSGSFLATSAHFWTLQWTHCSLHMVLASGYTMPSSTYCIGPWPSWSLPRDLWGSFCHIQCSQHHPANAAAKEAGEAHCGPTPSWWAINSRSDRPPYMRTNSWMEASRGCLTSSSPFTQFTLTTTQTSSSLFWQQEYRHL